MRGSTWNKININTQKRHCENPEVQRKITPFTSLNRKHLKINFSYTAMTMASNISFCFLPPSQRRRTPLISSWKLEPQPRSQPPTVVRTLGILETFSNLKEKGKVAFIPYITAGDPDLRTTLKALKVLDSCGSDIIELGMPYSDPLVDGQVIQAAAARALANGTNFNDIISMLKEVIPQLSCPIVLLSYYNPILKRGIAKFMSTISNAGVHGLVVPDIPLEETGILRSEARKHNIELALLTTPITPTERMKAITKASEGFVYLVRSAGVTGNHAPVCSNVQSLLQEIKEVTNKPVAVGFGISKPDHVNQLSGWGADGVIVGSAMVKILGEAKSSEDGLKALEIFTRSLKTSLP